jgi:hypothetical protein
MAIQLSRRALLRGVGGVAVALPALECMFDNNGIAYAGGGGMPPKRYAILFAGQSIGGDGWAHDSSRVDGQDVTEQGHHIAPVQAGAGYTVTTPLQPLADLDLINDVTVVSGMSIPWNASSSDPSAVPAGGAYREFHGGVCSPLLSGTRSLANSYVCNGITSDQVVGQMNAGACPYDSLVFRSQPSFYLSGYSFSGREYISYSGPGERIEAQASPQTAYMQIFGNFTPDNEADLAVLDFTLRTRRSVLDLITAKRERVLGQVGAADRIRLERHFDEIRMLEERLSAVNPSGNCERPMDPGADPPVGGDNAGSGSGDIGQNTGYSDEALRSQVFADLIAMAFTCDLTRAATLEITTFQCHMNVFQPTNAMGSAITADLHEVGHNGDANNRGQIAVSTCLQWHMQFYAYLVDKLKNTPEGAGSVLDNTVALFVPEGGHGTQLDDGVTENAAHSVEGMAMVIAGGTSGGITSHGQHIASPGTHPAQVLISGMQAAGVQGDSLGEVSGNVPELFA